MPPPPPAPSPTRWIVLGAAALVLGAGLTWWWLSRAQPSTVPPAATAATEAAVPRNRPKSQNWDLPSLDDSDSFLRPLVAALSQRPELARLLATQSLIRNVTLAIVQIGDGKTPATPFAVLRPTSRLAIIGSAPSGKIDPASYGRWDGATASLVSIRPGDLALFYVNVKLLFDQAYSELGHPSADFDEAIIKAIDTLVETPQVDQDPVLVRKQPGLLRARESDAANAAARAEAVPADGPGESAQDHRVAQAGRHEPRLEDRLTWALLVPQRDERID